MGKEGIIKFKYHCKDSLYSIPEDAYSQLNRTRQILFEKGLIGVCDSGIGFGNLSLRIPGTEEFYITVSDTGKHRFLKPEHYVKIISCDWENNSCTYKGKLLPSSESLSHFIIYKYQPLVQAVIHIHSPSLWKQYKNLWPTTNDKVEYGSKEMVKEIKRLFYEKVLKTDDVFIMGGHQDGLISFGVSLQNALKTLPVEI